MIQKNFTPCLHEWKWYERTSEKKTSSNLPTSYMNAYVRFSLHVLFEVLHLDFLLMALQRLLSQKLVIFFTSMIPIVLIEAITSPCKPCLHGILWPSWSKHHYHFPLLHIHLINTLPSFRCFTTLSSRRLPAALIHSPICSHFWQAHTSYHSLSHFSLQ